MAAGNAVISTTSLRVMSVPSSLNARGAPPPLASAPRRSFTSRGSRCQCYDGLKIPMRLLFVGLIAAVVLAPGAASQQGLTPEQRAALLNPDAPQFAVHAPDRCLVRL